VERLGEKTDVDKQDIPEIPDQKESSNPEIVPILFHPKKQQILAELIKQEMTIVDLKNKLMINPGTVKRHLDDLIKVGLVVESRTIQNQFKMVMKFYRATAKQFECHFVWPESID
jgi:DNA-binding MarR family transcriptional regulator